MKDSVYNVSFKKLSALWLQTFTRKKIMLAFVAVLVSPLESMFTDFMSQRKQVLQKLKYNYQVISLRKRLNDVFDKSQRRIRIISAVQYNGTYLYLEAEDDAYRSKTRFLGKLFLRNENELFSDYDFIVEIPNTGIDQISLTAEIDFFILPTKRYKIIIA